MPVFGGEFRFRYDGGNPLVMRGEATIDPTHTENTTIVNQNGSLAKIVANMPYKLECTFEDANGVDWDSIMLLSGVDCTVTEDHTGVVYTCTGGHFEGKPRVNRNNGEVSGLSFVARQFRKSE